MDKTSTLLAQFKRCRNRSVPIVVVRTADPAAAMALLAPACDAARTYRWDLLRGCVPEPVNASLPPMSPDDALNGARHLPEKAALFMVNAHKWWNDPGAIQGIWNLRDINKQNYRTLILLVLSGASVPPELTSDVIVLDHALPTRDELRALVTELHTNGQIDPPAAEDLDRIVDAVSGVHLFGAENCLSITLQTPAQIAETGKTVDLDALEERKRIVIEQTEGLTTWRGGETYAQLGGLASIKMFGHAWITGQARPGCILWLDQHQVPLAG